MKTSEAEGEVLNYLVAKCEGRDQFFSLNQPKHKEHCFSLMTYSTDWAQGGPIIEREGIELFRNNEKNYWFTSKARGQIGTGPTPLVAAMRAYVASKLGDEVEIPEGLGEVTA